MDLIEFLRARLDEDAELARKAAFGWGPDWTAHDDSVSLGDDMAHIEADGSPYVAGSEDIDVMSHAARWDPTRVLAEVAAKQAIIKLGICNACAVEYQPCDHRDNTLFALAQPYTEHPDFDPAWLSRCPR